MATAKEGQLRIIAGRWRGRKICFLDQDGLRPTPDRVRETLFNWLQADIPGATCLDLFSGSGALGFEAASRGARSVTLVDNSVRTCKMLQQASSVLDAGSVETVRSDAIDFLESHVDRYDIVFLDPPYQLNILPRIFQRLEQKKCLAEHAKIYVEHDVKQDLPELPENWQVLKNKTAGQVAYSLIERTET